MKEQSRTYLKLRIFETAILNTKWKNCKFRINLCTKNFMCTKNFTYTKLPPYIYQKFTSWKTQRKHVSQTIAIEKFMFRLIFTLWSLRITFFYLQFIHGMFCSDLWETLKETICKWPLNLWWISNKLELRKLENTTKAAAFKSFLHLSY